MRWLSRDNLKNMKQNKTKLYAEALAGVILEKNYEGPERERRIVKRFLDLLERDGQMRHAKEIVAQAQDLFIKKTGRRKITLETARKVDKKALLTALMDAGDVVEEKTNKDLIAGIKIIIDYKQLDMSLKNKLQKIFK